MMEQDRILEYPLPHNIRVLQAAIIVSRQRLPYKYKDSQRQSDTQYYVFSYKIHPAVLILPAVFIQSINMDMSVQTKDVTGTEKF